MAIPRGCTGHILVSRGSDHDRQQPYSWFRPFALSRRPNVVHGQPVAGGTRLMRRVTRREVVAGAIAPALASCGRSTARRPQDSSTVTVLYLGGPETVLDPAYMAGKFLVFMPLAAW